MPFYHYLRLRPTDITIPHIQPTTEYQLPPVVVTTPTVSSYTFTYDCSLPISQPSMSTVVKLRPTDIATLHEYRGQTRYLPIRMMSPCKNAPWAIHVSLVHQPAQTPSGGYSNQAETRSLKRYLSHVSTVTRGIIQIKPAREFCDPSRHEDKTEYDLHVGAVCIKHNCRPCSSPLQLFFLFFFKINSILTYNIYLWRGPLKS